MFKRLAVAAALLACAFALRAEETAPVLYQIDLVPSGKLISRDLPVLKGTSYLLHQYPTGTLLSVRKSTVKQIVKMTAAAAAAINPTSAKRIRNLAFQGPRDAAVAGTSAVAGRYSVIDHARSAAGAANEGMANRTASPDE